MKRTVVALALTGLVAGSGTTDIEASRPERSFRRVGTLANYRNLASRADETVSEIIAATADGKTLVYTDSVGGSIGFIDIKNPGQPAPLGSLSLGSDPRNGVDYSPTSVDVLGNQYALVAANSSESFTDTSGSLLVVDISARAIVADIALGGQPDSIKISHDRRYAAIAIENERDEALCVGGSNDGLEVDDDECESGGGTLGVLPQTPHGNPPGFLAVVELTGPAAAWTAARVDLTGYSAYAPEDPEPEFVDINSRNEAVVTLQENNHVVIVDLGTLAVTGDFGAGAVDLNGVDATEDGVISLSDAIPGVLREPDAVAWVPGPSGPHIATANEGDLFGGSRGFSIFGRNGTVRFDSGTAFEELAVRHGHYPEDRSENKGTEPESVTYGSFGPDDYLFVGSERGNFVAVFTIDSAGVPRFKQLLPGPLGPEGLLVVPNRNLVVASGEVDTPEFGVRSTVMIYELESEGPTYPEILSDDAGGSPIPWSALSGLTAIPGQSDALLAVWDSYYSVSNIFRIDVSERPAVITDVMSIQGGSGNYDPEGIAIAPDDTIWIASEGDAADSRPNLLVQVDANGQVLQEVGLPPEIIACRAASTRRATLGSGFEGVAVQRSLGTSNYRLLVAQQRGWDYTSAECEDLDDDGGGLNALGQPNWTRIWTYDPQTDTWDHVAWELASKPANAAWVGLSEITELADGGYILIERDNLSGDFGKLKTLVKIGDQAAADGVVSEEEKSVHDLRPALLATNGWITDKPEGVAVTDDGQTFVVTDNDGVEDWSGETWFLPLGDYSNLF